MKRPKADGREAHTEQSGATLGEATRERLGKPVASGALRKAYEVITGERMNRRWPPTWAQLIAARGALRAVLSSSGTRDAKELRDATEGRQGGTGRRAGFVLSLDGLPRTNAVTGRAPQ